MIGESLTLTLEQPYQTPFGYQKLPFFYACEQSRWKSVRKIAKRLRKTVMGWWPNIFWGILSYQKTPDQAVLLKYRAANAQFMFALTKPQWEKEVFSLLQYVLPKINHFYDIGANWGQHSLFAVSLRQFKGDVHAFEPMPTTYKDLKSIVEQSNLTHRIHSYSYALGHQESVMSLGVRNKTVTGQASLGDPKAKHTVAVDVKVLDTLIQSGVLPPPDLIKLDVEGFEEQVLKGAFETLNAHRPFVVMENWPDGHRREAVLAPLVHLESHNYRLFTMIVEGNNIILTPFLAKDRFLTSANPDIFACPVEKVGVL